MKSAEELGKRIRKERKLLGVTQKDLALAAGTGLRYIVDLEKGKPTAQIGKMIDVLQALGLELSIGRRG